MSTVRQRAKAAVKPDKKVVKPVLTNSLTIGWYVEAGVCYSDSANSSSIHRPELSKPAQAQIETALWELLKPVAQIREEQYHSASNESAEQMPPQASTSRVTLDMPARPNDPEAPAPEKSVAVQDVPLPVDDAADPSVDSERAMSKRAKRRAKVRQQVEERDAHLPPSVHEIHLRSDRLVQIPDRLHPDGFLRKLRLDADKAITTRPAICDAMVIGLNAVTRSLEEAVDNSRRRLAGLPIIASSGKVSSQDNLRLFIPSPSRGTRRDRRALRERLHPTSRSSKYASRAKKLLSRLPESPVHISVPRNEPSLVSALESVLHSSKLSQQTSEDKMLEIAVTALLNTVRGESPPNNASDMKVDEATANSRENASVRIPSSDIEKLLLADKPSVTDPHDRHLLLSLFTRFNPNYFRTEQDRFQKLRSIARYKLLAKAAAEIDDTPPVEKKPLRLVFVAKEDINPLRIAEHLLITVAAQNSLNMAKRRDFRDDSDSSGINDDVYLVPLGKGAEEKMAKLLGLRRVSVLAFTVGYLSFSTKIQSLMVLLIGRLNSGVCKAGATRQDSLASAFVCRLADTGNK